MRENLQIVITGMGVVNSVASDIPEFSVALKNGTSRFTFSNSKKIAGAYLSNDIHFDQIVEQRIKEKSEQQKISKIFRNSSRVSQIAALVALEATRQCPLDSSVSRDRIGIVVGGSNLNQQSQYENMKKFQAEGSLANPLYGLAFLDTDIVGRLSEMLNIKGWGSTIGAASASGNAAIIQAFHLIRSGAIDVCYVVAPPADFSELEFEGLARLGALYSEQTLTPEKVCRPFDKEHSGFVFGEGAGCLILATEEVAKRSNLNQLAYVAGGSLVLDGHHQTQPSIDSEVRCMKNSLLMARIHEDEITYINTHGSSSPSGDITELQAIEKAFPNSYREILLNSTKSITGHCLFSAGVIEAIASVIQMQHQFLHPNLNLDTPIDSRFTFVGNQSQKYNFNKVLSNSFGFGGIHSSILLTKAE